MKAILRWDRFSYLLEVEPPPLPHITIPLSMPISSDEPAPLSVSAGAGWTFEFKGLQPDGWALYEATEPPWQAQIRAMLATYSEVMP